MANSMKSGKSKGAKNCKGKESSKSCRTYRQKDGKAEKSCRLKGGA